MRVLTLLKTADGGRWSVPPAQALAARGHEVVFALPSLSGALPDLVRAAGMDVVRAEAPLVGGGVLHQPAALRRLRAQVRRFAPDVVVSHLYASAVAGRMAVARTPVPHVYMSAGPLYLENAAIRSAERLLWRLDDHLICSSAHLAERYRALGVPASRLSVIPYGATKEWASGGGDGGRLRASLNADGSGFVAACIALFYAPKRLVHRGQGIKGHDVLLEAWRRYTGEGGPGTLALVGGGFGPGGDEYREAVRQRFAAVERVRWIGTVDDVRPYYRAADVSVSPSLSDNLGAPAEAATLGIPSIASRVGGLAEMVVPGWSGWLVPPRDPGALAAALHEAAAMGPAERARLGERARMRAAELFDQGRNSEAFAETVERVVAASRRRR